MTSTKIASDGRSRLARGLEILMARQKARPPAAPSPLLVAVAEEILNRKNTLLGPPVFAARDIEEWRCQDSARKKMLAATIRREIATRADELKRCGVRNPVARAEEEIAKRWQRTGVTLNRWLRRHR